MGQAQSSPSKSNVSDVYSSYISQQQRLIQLQQQQINNLYKEYFKDINPCRTTVEVRSLPTPISVELKCVAFIGDKG